MPALLAPQNFTATSWDSETPNLQLQIPSSVGVPVILAELSLGEEVTPRSDGGDWYLLSISLIFWDAFPYITKPCLLEAQVEIGMDAQVVYHSFHSVPTAWILLEHPGVCPDVHLEWPTVKQLMVYGENRTVTREC